MRRFAAKQLTQVSRRYITTFAASQSARESIVHCDPVKPFPGFQPLFKKDNPVTYQMTKLDSGVTILTENSPFPYHTDIGLLGNFGTRNETNATAGSMKMLRNLLHMGGDEKAILENYEVNHFNGGGLDMTFDQESTFYKCSCIPEDTERMLTLLLDTSLQSKDFSLFDASILADEADQVIFEEQFLKAAFDGKGVGQCGVNVNMTQEDFQQFQTNYVTPSRVIISAANVPSHDSFVNLVSQQLKRYPEFLKRTYQPNLTQSIYTGNELRIETDSDSVEIGVGFKSVDWMHKDMMILQVILIMVGNSSYFSTGGPGKGMHSRATKNLLNRLSFVQGADCISNIFSDCGLFGLKLTGPSEEANNLIDACVKELLLLTKPISPIELQRSKNILKSLMNLALERQQDRLEEATKHIMNFKKIRLDEAESLVEKVTSEDINSVVRNLIKSSRPTITMVGKGVTKAQSFDKIATSLISKV